MKTPSKKYTSISFENGIWSGPKAVYPDDSPTIGKRLLETLKQSPDFIGQIDSSTGEKDTFGQMMERSIRCALWLKKQGIRPGDVVSVSTHNHLNTVTEEEIKDLVEKNLPDRMRLRGGVVFLDKMPFNTSGKIDKKSLRRLINNY